MLPEAHADRARTATQGIHLGEITVIRWSVGIEATDAQFSRMNIDKSERKLETFKSNITEMTRSDQSRGQVFHERDKLMRQYERMKAELQTYENNIGFLTSSSKKGNSLVDDMNNKIEKIKAELELIVKKVDAIDEKI